MSPKWVFVTVGGIATVAGVGGAMVLRSQLGPLSLSEELAAARQEGLIVDPTAWKEPRLAAKEDGTAAYEKACELSNKVVDGKGWNLEFHPLAGPIDRPIPVATHSPAKRAELARVIAKQDAGLAALREAGLRGRFTIPSEGKHPFLIFRDDVMRIRNLTKVLVVRSDLRRVEGDLAGAREDAMTLARAAALYRDRRTTNEGLSRVGIEREALRAAQEYAAARPQDPESPALLRKVVTTFGPPADVRQMLAGEVLLSLGYVEGSSQFEKDWVGRDAMLRLGPVRDANLARQVSYWRTLFKALPKDPLDYAGASHALITTTNTFARDTSLRAIVATTCLREAEFLAQGEARRRVAQAAAGVLEAWQRDGKLPSSLPGSFRDPFDGAPLRYLPTAQGFTVYSIDRDGVDHRGGARDIALKVGLR